MSYMQEFFNSEATFAPYSTRLIAVKAHSFGNGLASTRATLLSIE